MGKTQRDYSLDVIKIISTLFIIFHHYQQIYKVTFEKGINYFGGAFYFGYIVELFFILSGFFMFPYIRKIREGLDFKGFFSRRYLRLFPLMMICAAAYEVLYIIKLYLTDGTLVGTKTTLWGTIVAGLGLQTGWTFPNLQINNPTWYLGILLVCYILFYMIVRLCSAKFKSEEFVLYACLIIIIFATAILNSEEKLEYPFINTQAARGYLSFFTGVLLAMFLEKREINRKGYILCIIIVILFPVLFIKANEFVKNGIRYLLTFFFYPALIILFSSPKAKSIFRFRWIGTLGQIAFDMYMWHINVFNGIAILLILLDKSVDHASRRIMYLYVLAVFIAGFISYYLIEKPINRRIRKREQAQIDKEKL